MFQMFSDVLAVTAPLISRFAAPVVPAAAPVFELVVTATAPVAPVAPVAAATGCAAWSIPLIAGCVAIVAIVAIVGIYALTCSAFMSHRRQTVVQIRR